MHQGLVLDQEKVRINEQHKRELENNEISLTLMSEDLRHQKEAQEVRDGDILELKAMVETFMGQVKGKGKVSDPPPEASGPRGGNPPLPPGKRVAGAPGGGGGGDPHDEGERSVSKPDESRKGRRGERPAPQPEDEYDAEDDEEFNLCW